MKRIISKHHSMCKVVIEIPLFSFSAYTMHCEAKKTSHCNTHQAKQILFLLTLNVFCYLLYNKSKTKCGKFKLGAYIRTSLIQLCDKKSAKLSLWKAVCCCEALYKYKMCAPLKRQRVAHCALGRVMPIAFEPRASRQLRHFEMVTR